MRSTLKKELLNLLTGNKDKKSSTLVAIKRELGIYKVENIQYNEQEFQALCKEYENTITVVIVRNNE
jgi:hypothetical protein